MAPDLHTCAETWLERGFASLCYTSMYVYMYTFTANICLDSQLDFRSYLFILAFVCTLMFMFVFICIVVFAVVFTFIFMLRPIFTLTLQVCLDLD